LGNAKLRPNPQIHSTRAVSNTSPDTDLPITASIAFNHAVAIHCCCKSQWTNRLCHHACLDYGLLAMGILGDGERKSTEPIAARACPDPKQVNNFHSRLLYFLAHGKWDDRAVRLEAAKYALEAMQNDGFVAPWIIDDTGFLKQGVHSVGVQRQYTGSAGKIANCQIGVSLCAATEHDHVLLDFALYLPQPWVDDVELRRETRIPDDAIFQTKVELALGMIERAVQAGVTGSIVLADSAYGDNTNFRNAVRYLWNLDYALGVGQSELSNRLTRKDFRKFTWRDGTKSPMSSNFYFLRVKTNHDDGIALQDRDPLWLLIEWPDSEPQPTKSGLTTLPATMNKKSIVSILKGSDSEQDMLSRAIADARHALHCRRDLRVAVIQDGAHEMWNLVRPELNVLKDKGVVVTWYEAIDFCHLIERLGDALELIVCQSRQWQLQIWRRSLVEDDTAIDAIASYLRSRTPRVKKSARNSKDTSPVSKTTTTGCAINPCVSKGCPSAEASPKAPAKRLRICAPKARGNDGVSPGLRGALHLRALNASNRFDALWVHFAKAHVANVNNCAHAA
jgi:hypothetical protein